jgi:hypothetical protein
MGWEMRGSYGPYYTRSRRRGGRVVREYIGGGETGQVIAELDDAERQERDEAKADREREHRELAEADRLLQDHGRILSTLVKEMLGSAGYHMHRGQWRQRRED